MKRALAFCVILIALILPVTAQYPPLPSAPRTQVDTSLASTRNRSLLDFGAKCDGRTDDTTAIRNWAAQLASGLTLVAPTGTCIFKSAITFGSGAGTIYGASVVGQGLNSVFKYEGSPTTANLLTFGAPGTNYEFDQGYLANFRVTSTTRMTGGAGILLYKFGRGLVSSVYADGQDGSHNLWNGFVCAGCNDMSISQAESEVQNDALQSYSIVTSLNPLNCYCGPVYLVGGKYSGSTAGVHEAAVASVTVDGADIIGNKYNVLINTSEAAACNCLSNAGNQAFILGATAFVDSAAVDNVLVDDPANAFGNKIIWLYGSVATSKGTDVKIVRWNKSFGGSPGVVAIYGQISDAQQDGIVVQDPYTQVVLAPGAYVNNNGMSGFGYGVNCAVPTNNVSVLTRFFANNSGGDIASNCTNARGR